MLNFLLFLGSCGLIAGFAWYFCALGQSALTAWIALLSLLANLFVLKQIDLIGLNATASDIFAIGGLLGLNLLQEKYGKKAAQTAIWTSFSCLLFFAVMAQIHLFYVPSEFDHAQSAYLSILGASPRIFIASIVTFLIVDQCDSHLYQWLRQRLPSVSLFLVSGVTMCFSQFLDTLLFSLLALYGMMSALIEIMLVSYSIKLIAIANTVPWSFITQRLFISKSHVN